MSPRRPPSDLNEAATLERELRKLAGILARRINRVRLLRAKLRAAEKELAEARVQLKLHTKATVPPPESIYAPPGEALATARDGEDDLF
jgi:hypothetical protein